MRSRRLARFSVAGCLLACLVFVCVRPHGEAEPPAPPGVSMHETARADELIRRQPGFFVPNLGQWDHAARFVHRSGPMTLFLEDRGWVVDVVERPAGHETGRHERRRGVVCRDGEVERTTRGVALRMTFEGEPCVPEVVGERRGPGHHDYFLGDDENRWRTGVPLYGSVRYEGLYPGIDLRLRECDRVPEYDLLLEPGADLSRVTVKVEGAKGLSLAEDGSLVVATALGPLTQPVPKTWQSDADGGKREVVCNFTLLGADRFGFDAPGWDGETSLTIDPGLIWSTFFGGSNGDVAVAMSVDARGVVTVAGMTTSTSFPTTRGAYDTTHNGNRKIFVSRLDPGRTGAAQLVYSTFLGGSSFDDQWGLAVEDSGVVTVAGRTGSTDFPTTKGAYDTTHNGPFPGTDIFVSRLDPRKTGKAQLVYSTFLGGGGNDWSGQKSLSVDSNGVVTVAGYTYWPVSSTQFPTTRGAYDTTHNAASDVFVSRLDPRKTGKAQLVYSTFLGGDGYDFCDAMTVDAAGVITLTGNTRSSAYFPTTRGAYDTTYSGGWDDAFVSRLDPSKTGSAQLVYSTLLGGGNSDVAYALAVDSGGVIAVAGVTLSTGFPTTPGAYDTTHNGPFFPRMGSDVFVSRLDPSKTGNAQLVYSTFLGAGGYDGPGALAVGDRGVVTVAGSTSSANFPTTAGAYDTTYNLGDVFVSRLDPSKAGTAQLVYSTFLGGSGGVESVWATSVDASGVVTVAGYTGSIDFPTTRGSYRTAYYGGSSDAFVSRLDMGVPMYGDVHEVSIRTGGSQRLTVNAGKAHANRSYWIFGSVTGTKPGLNLLGVHIPLNPDPYTDIAMANANSAVFARFRGTLDTNGLATASFNVRANLPAPPGFTFHHACVVFDSRRFHLASNAVPLRLK